MSFRPLVLDGDMFEESELLRPDFGPIGRKPFNEGSQYHREKNDVLKFSWVSDFIKKDGSLLTENLRRTGVAPCLPKLPVSCNGGFRKTAQPLSSPGTACGLHQKQWNPLQSVDDDLISVAAKVIQASSLDHGSSSSVRISTRSPESGYGSTLASSSSSIYGSSTSLNSITSGNAMSSPEEVFQCLPIGRKKGWPRSCNEKDMVEFINRFQYPVSFRRSFFHRPRSGKYYIKFNE